MDKIIIAATSLNRVIGREGGLPWHLPADLAFLAEQLRTGFLLTGRTSYESSQGRGLFTDREEVIVVTRQESYQPYSKAWVAASLPTAIDLAKKEEATRLLILGGAEIYRQAIDIADVLIITQVQTVIVGDAFFPVIDPEQWILQHREDHPADDENAFPFAFLWYRRSKNGAGNDKNQQ